jgi:hypothetical protein
MKINDNIYNHMNYSILKKHSAFKNIGTIIIVNLIPFYETYADQLGTFGVNIIDKQNQDTIADLTSKHKNVIIAWGNHPKGLYKEYKQLKQITFDTLRTNKNNVFYVDKLSKNGNPRHGQVWGYEKELLNFNLDNIN